MRLIDADALHECFNACFNSGYENFDADGIREMIDDAPTIEAQPVMHGEWVMIKDMRSNTNAIGCSICGSMEFVRNDALLNITNVNRNNFCPNCGADMKKKV